MNNNWPHAHPSGLIAKPFPIAPESEVSLRAFNLACLPKVNLLRTAIPNHTLATRTLRIFKSIQMHPFSSMSRLLERRLKKNFLLKQSHLLDLSLFPKTRCPTEKLPNSPSLGQEESVRHGISTLKAGKTVELDNGQFLFIIDVVRNLQSDLVKLRGWSLKRCPHMDGMLRRGANELCFIFEVELDDPRSIHVQSMVEIELAGVIKVRELVRTDYPFHTFDSPNPTRSPTISLQICYSLGTIIVSWLVGSILLNMQIVESV